MGAKAETDLKAAGFFSASTSAPCPPMLCPQMEACSGGGRGEGGMAPAVAASLAGADTPPYIPEFRSQPCQPASDTPRLPATPPPSLPASPPPHSRCQGPGQAACAAPGAAPAECSCAAGEGGRWGWTFRGPHLQHRMDGSTAVCDTLLHAPAAAADKQALVPAAPPTPPVHAVVLPLVGGGCTWTSMGRVLSWLTRQPKELVTLLVTPLPCWNHGSVCATPLSAPST